MSKSLTLDVLDCVWRVEVDLFVSFGSPKHCRKTCGASEECNASPKYIGKTDYYKYSRKNMSCRCILVALDCHSVPLWFTQMAYMLEARPLTVPQSLNRIQQRAEPFLQEVELVWNINLSSIYFLQ